MVYKKIVRYGIIFKTYSLVFSLSHAIDFSSPCSIARSKYKHHPQTCNKPFTNPNSLLMVWASFRVKSLALDGKKHQSNYLTIFVTNITFKHDLTWNIKTGRVHSMTPFLLIVALWLYLLFTKLSMGMWKH